MCTLMSEQFRKFNDVYQTFRETVMLILYIPFQRIGNEHTHPSSFYECSNTLIAKLEQDATRQKNRLIWRNIDAKLLKYLQTKSIYI